MVHRERPAFRSPAKLADDLRTIGTFSRAPIFLVHDPRMGGMHRAVDLFSRLETLRPANELIFELYYPAGDDFFSMVKRSVKTWGAELTLESPDERLRAINGKWPWPNAKVEATIESALAHGCRTLDVFFMTGLPHQTEADALAIPDYCERLLERFGSRVRPFIAPLPHSSIQAAARSRSHRSAITASAARSPTTVGHSCTAAGSRSCRMKPTGCRGRKLRASLTPPPSD
jgi:hypothetical protein